MCAMQDKLEEKGIQKKMTVRSMFMQIHNYLCTDLKYMILSSNLWKELCFQNSEVWWVLFIKEKKKSHLPVCVSNFKTFSNPSSPPQAMKP